MAAFGLAVALSVAGLARPELRPWPFWLDVALLLAFAWDAWATPSPLRLQVERSVPGRVGLSRDFGRRITLAHPRAAGLALEVHERFPPAFHVRARTVGDETGEPAAGDPSGGPDLGRFDEQGRVELERTYRCDRRGAFSLGELRVLLRGRLGLVQRVGVLHGEQAVAVEPALLDLSNTLRLAASDRWQDLGVRLLRRRGGETEFESLRDYVHGDDVRRLDWKAFARRGKPMVREYEVERGQELLLVVDCGRRMRVMTAKGRAQGWSKLDWALDAVLELAAVALSKGDRVGAAAFDAGVRAYVTPARGSRQLARLSRALFDLQPTAHDSDLEHALRELAVRHRRRATVIVVSDVADPYSISEQRRALSAASRRHRLVFCALDDPGLTAAAAGEGVSASVRAAALELVEDRRRALRRLATSGTRVLDALPAQAAAPMLAAWLEGRRA